MITAAAFRFSIISLTISALLCIFAACTKAPPRPSATAFINRGPMAVSADNPYLGTNRYLEDYSVIDLNLKGFLDQEGLPDALELKTLSGQPLQMYLYYINRNKSYRCLENEMGWTVFSPESLDKNTLKALAGVSSLREQYPDLAQHKTPRVAKTTPKTSSGQDIIHTVGDLGETLQTVANKYTGSHEVVGTLARINGLDPIEILKVGTVVRIPSYLATKQHRAQKPGKAKPKLSPPPVHKPSAIE